VHSIARTRGAEIVRGRRGANDSPCPLFDRRGVMHNNALRGDTEMHTRTTAIRRERKLAAILSADVKGYSRLMGGMRKRPSTPLTAYRK